MQCIGAGQRRYKFTKPQTHRQRRSDDDRSESGRSSSGSSATLSVSRPPDSPLSSLTSAFWAIVNPSCDFRFNLAAGYGQYLYDVPRRLGRNAALDAAAAAIVQAHSDFCCGQVVSIGGLRLYSNALRTLRVSLDDLATARSIETLCAVMVLLSCQSLMDLGDGTWSGHCEGAMQLLQARGPSDPANVFESELVNTVRAPVLLEAIFNERLKLTVADTHAFDDIPGPIHFIAQAGDLVRRWSLVNSAFEVELLVGEAREFHQRYMDALAELSASVRVMDAQMAGTTSPPMVLVQAHAQVHQILGIWLSVAIVCNCVVSAIDSERRTELTRGRTRLIQEALAVIDSVSNYGPLGASHVPMTLGAAYIGAEDQTTKDAIESALEKHKKTGFAAPETSRLIANLAFATRHFRRRLRPKALILAGDLQARALVRQITPPQCIWA